MEFTFLFLNLAKIHIFIPKCTEGGGGGGKPVEDIFLKKTIFDCFPKQNAHRAEDNIKGWENHPEH